MDKLQLIQHLNQNTWISLRPSTIHGIGVFALRNIPRGCDTIFSNILDEWIYLTFDEVKQLPSHSQYLIETYCLFDELGYFVPAHGFEKMDLALYLNHDENPNVASINDGEKFIALRDIQEGEELFVDYGSIVDG